MKLKSNTNVFLILLVCSLNFTYAHTKECFSKLVNNIATMEADYVQHIYAKKGKIIGVNKGHFMYKYPNFVRWQNTGEEKSLTIHDGNYLWQYEPDLEQVIKTKSSNEFNISNPISVIADITNLKKSFNIQNIDIAGKLQKFMLTAKNNPKTKLWITFNQKELTKIEYYDSLQNLNELKFSKIEHNNISDKWFTFVPEENIDIIEQ